MKIKFGCCRAADYLRRLRSCNGLAASSCHFLLSIDNDRKREREREREREKGKREKGKRERERERERERKRERERERIQSKLSHFQVVSKKEIPMN
jgi:hypothetical protein